MPAVDRSYLLPPLTAKESDLELAQRAAAGSTQAFEVIMRRHNRLLFRTGRSILKSDADTEDALQDAYVRAWKALPGFRADAKLTTWLVRIVINEALARLRRHGAVVIPLEATGDAEATAEETAEADPDDQPERMRMRDEMRQLMEAHIDRLPDAYRSVFILRAVEELNVEEVAAALDLPPATVRTRYFRARGLLREGLARELDVAMSDAFSFDGARCDRIVNHVLTRLSP